MTAILVPFRPDGAERDRNWKWVEARYRALYPEWEVIEGRHTEGKWCKGAAVRDALSKTKADKLVISDADMILEDAVMRSGVESLDEHPWVVPHRQALRLTEEASVEVMAGRLDAKDVTHDHLEYGPRSMYAGGGIVFVRRAAYEAIGGFDERFRGWGGEDEALGMALEARFGPPKVLGAVLYHLFHQPQAEMPVDRRRPEHAEKLIRPYELALGR